MTESTNYKVEAKIDSKWFDNEYVFPYKEDAMQYGDSLVESGSVEDFRIRETVNPIKLPVP